MMMLTSSSILRISPLVGDECRDQFLDGMLELEAEVFLDGIMDSIPDIFLEPGPGVGAMELALSCEIFLPTGEVILSSLSLPPSSISSSANTSCLK